MVRQRILFGNDVANIVGARQSEGEGCPSPDDMNEAIFGMESPCQKTIIELLARKTGESGALSSELDLSLSWRFTIAPVSERCLSSRKIGKFPTHVWNFKTKIQEDR